MNYIIAHYDNYNERRYGTPWAAPCDSTGRPCFDGKTGRFTGGRGHGGDLFAEDPDEGSVWAYGQKDYKGNHTEKKYAQFRDGAFHPVTPDGLLDALASAQEHGITDKRKDEIIRALLTELEIWADDGFMDALTHAGITKEEAEAYGAKWRDKG